MIAKFLPVERVQRQERKFCKAARCKILSLSEKIVLIWYRLLLCYTRTEDSNVALRKSIDFFGYF